jgi:hypothetical protein
MEMSGLLGSVFNFNEIIHSAAMEMSRCQILSTVSQVRITSSFLGEIISMRLMMTVEGDDVLLVDVIWSMMIDHHGSSGW